jgi:hypothetical protein
MAGVAVAAVPRLTRGIASAIRHCERSEAIHSSNGKMDCFVANAPRNDADAVMARSNRWSQN